MTRIPAIRKRLKETTPGPWRLFKEREDEYTIANRREGPWTHGVVLSDVSVATPDAEFIAHAKADIRALLKYVPRLWWSWDSGKDAWDLWYRSPWDSKDTRVWLGQVADGGWATENQQEEELNEGTARRALIKALPTALRPLVPPFPTWRRK